MRWRGGSTLPAAAVIVATMAADLPSGHGATPLKSIRVAQGLTQPLFVTHAPGDFERVFIVEQTGRIKIRKNGVILPTAFLNVDPISLASGERGLLGLAFHPVYAVTGFFYIYYIDNAGDTVVARYQVSSDPDVADGSSALTILSFAQPRDAQGVFTNHKAGWIAFGPNDGYLYIASGDGGWRFLNQPDPFNNAQTITNNLLGKIVRINVDADDFPDDPNKNYAIPADNPFVGVTGDDEIWANGLRNPWRCAFDSQTGDVYIADVGHSAWEEIDFEPADSAGGRNYAWKCMEGAHCSGYGGCTCDDPSHTLPIHEYDHDVGCSITGGEVYRGCAIPDLAGAYFFADFCSNRIWSLTYDRGSGPPLVIERTAELDPAGVLAITGISSFGRDAAGEIYVCDRTGGEVFKIVADLALSIASSDPPDGAIDARRPIDPDGGAPVGWNGVTMSFSQPVVCFTELDFFSVQEGGIGAVPPVLDVAQVGPQQAEITLAGPLNPIAWTTITFETGGVSVQLGVLPADVDGSGTSDGADVTHLRQVLTGTLPARPIWSMDLDRSDMTTPADVLEAVDLLNGAGLYDMYLGESLP